jgi:GNAT superfamily N-acetyltransferase
MTIRAARPGDAPAMGRTMVASWLAAHRGQVPAEVWQQRQEEWTPEVSADAWSRLITEMATGETARHVLLVAEDGTDDGAELVGVVLGLPAGDASPTSATAEVGALYVTPERWGGGIGAALLRAAAAELVGLGFESLHIGVLTANHPARAFYEAMGGTEVGTRTFDEEGHELAGTVYAWPDLGSLTRP